MRWGWWWIDSYIRKMGINWEGLDLFFVFFLINFIYQKFDFCKVFFRGFLIVGCKLNLIEEKRCYEVKDRNKGELGNCFFFVFVLGCIFSGCCICFKVSFCWVDYFGCYLGCVILVLGFYYYYFQVQGSNCLQLLIFGFF